MLSDVITALATPPGRSALAIVRLSGNDAHECAAKLLDPFHPEPNRQNRLCSIRHPETREVLDRAVYSVYAAPNSYTGEDMVEISTHGGLIVPAGVLEASIAAGARQADPGEFTMRAVLNGKMDLLQAEAVADLVDAGGPVQRKVAIHQLDRGLTSRIEKLRSDFLELEALIGYDIDFPEEDSGPVSEERILCSVGELRRSMAQLLRTAAEGERVREGALAVIAGRPNTGKSSLFNALLGKNRAIVTEIAGTTRDAIDGQVTCNGFPFRLVDTAGLCDSDDRVEREGIEVSRAYLQDADLVLFCVEAGRAVTFDETEFIADVSAPHILVRTMIDIGGSGRIEEFGVSSVSGEGIAELREAMAGAAFSALLNQADYEPLLTRARHRVALTRASGELDEFASAIGSDLDIAIASTHILAAVSALEDVIGVVTTEDVLGRIFSDFCVGK
ncbi:MAG: tRNA uridine-5-carboxymethylaminomethyl(34) synthesis GTPase MnmE [Gemmatimonadetes bacterium]|nr:tRNA uridine-5-carboxymethylaminomethyl(34) synthesis GTPase MnmE [Gemmatimonadota bacterium]